MTVDTGLRHGRTGGSVSVLLRLASVAAGVVVAALLVVDFRLTGPASRQILAVALMAAFISAAVWATTSLTALLMRPSLRRAQGLLAEEADLWGSDREFFAPVRRLMLLGALQTLANLLIWLTVYPLALWASVLACGAVGLPARLTGLWPPSSRGCWWRPLRLLPGPSSPCSAAAPAARPRARWPPYCSMPPDLRSPRSSWTASDSTLRRGGGRRSPCVRWRVSSCCRASHCHCPYRESPRSSSSATTAWCCG